MSRINITLDDNLKVLAENQAKSLGLSLSSFIRLLLVSNLKLNGIDQALLDLKNGNYETYTAEEFRAKLKEDIKSAKA